MALRTVPGESSFEILEVRIECGGVVVVVCRSR
jgi:hypothetical protein